MSDHTSPGVLGGSSNAHCLSRLQHAYTSLTETARAVADVILQQPSEVVGLSITELARRSKVSESTVLRLARGLGYEGYRDFTIALASSVSAEVEPLLQVDIGDLDELSTIVQKVFSAEAQALAKAWETIDSEELQRAVEALVKARRVHCYAVGGSGLLAMEAVYRFVRVGIDCYAVCDPIQIAIQAGRLTPEDVAIGFSQTGRTRDTVEGVRVARKAGATTICVTSRANTPIVAASDIALVLLELHTAYRGAYLDSKIAELTLVDALSTCLAQQMPSRPTADSERLEASIERMFLRRQRTSRRDHPSSPEPAG